MRGYLTKVLALLHFEPPYFEEHGVPCEFVGTLCCKAVPIADLPRNFVENIISHQDRRLLNISAVGKARLRGTFPSYRAPRMLANHRSIRPVFRQITSPNRQSHMSKWNFNIHFVNETDKYDAFAALDSALAASGTVALELALANVPFITIYKMAPLSNYLARRLVNLKYVNLINILLDKQVVPELLLESCKAELIAPALEDVWTKKDVREQQIFDFREALKLLGTGHEPPGVRAAKAVLDLLDHTVTLQSTKTRL